MSLLYLTPGIGRDSVLKIMGVGKQSICCPMRSVTNPYRTELYRADGSTFEILYYLTDSKTRASAPATAGESDQVEDEDLMPLVLRDGKLDGWGWSYWRDVAQKLDIRIRP